MQDPMENSQVGDILFRLGEMQGTVKASLDQIARINSELIRMHHEGDVKHRENQEMMEAVRIEFKKMIDDHIDDDERRFAEHETKLNRANNFQVSILSILGFIQVVFMVTVAFLNLN